ncbi:hypothetical protein F511_43483 [Dorcoceras hygrometricum]|uniref:Uncharacterized protein n=1 Tax=Dorcoceras hygrometricum TaxID=472368 RepID=A0A2Z7BFW5_9LAMI|nr:hypothetical protein F511_43483 [Dorcoceras hygrometricum]
METSKVESAVRNQAEAKLNQLERSESAGTMRRPAASARDRSDVVEEDSSRKLLLTNLLAVAILITVDESMSNVEQEADNSKRNSEESDVVLNYQQMVRVQQMKKTAGALSIDDVISSDITISRKLVFTSR